MALRARITTLSANQHLPINADGVASLGWRTDTEGSEREETS
jgi:hypothetical protein